jgi:hypothetical protein
MASQKDNLNGLCIVIPFCSENGLKCIAATATDVVQALETLFN